MYVSPSIKQIDVLNIIALFTPEARSFHLHELFLFHGIELDSFSL